MVRIPLRQLSLTTLTFATAAPLACAQAPAAPAAPVAPAAPAAAPAGLPTFLLPVPAGDAEMGLTAEELINVASQAVSPMRPANAVKAPEKLATAMRRTSSTLGTRKVHVDAFLLGKWPVKNAEYETYVAHKRAAKLKVRPPFSWWKVGAKADYEAKLADIAREFPKDPEGPVRFWERHGHELPYGTNDESGKPIADQPVPFVSFVEANEFAGWLGMRLPTEAEWTRAARGDGTHLWPWGAANQDDTYTEAKLAFLGLDRSAGQKPNVVGQIANATGPYGHLDMFGRIWQLIADKGYRPMNGQDLFAEQWKVLQKDRVGAILKAPPAWKDDRVLAKGGSYLSWQEPVQLLVDARAPMQSEDVLEGLGFRLAKSLRPGFDMLYSMLRGPYNRGAYAPEQVPDEANQVGVERYELGPNGFPTAYHAVSFMPVTWLSTEKNADLGKLLERTHQQPLVLGALATTMALKNPDLPAGLYTVLYRKEGMPKELVDAIKAGHKVVQQALKSKEKDKGGDEDPEADKKKNAWRDVLKKYGLTEVDLEPKGAVEDLKFIRLNGVQVTTEHPVFLLTDSLEAKVVGVIPAKGHPTAAANFAAELTFEKSDKVGSIATFHFGSPIKATEPKRVAEFRLDLHVDCPTPTAEQNWRLPIKAEPARAAR